MQVLFELTFMDIEQIILTKRCVDKFWYPVKSMRVFLLIQTLSLVLLQENWENINFKRLEES